MQIKRTELLAALVYVGGALEKKTTIPILSNVSLSSIEGQLIVAASDLDITKRATVKAEGNGINIAVAGKKLIEVIKASSADEITLTQNDLKLTIKAEAKFTMLGVATKDFPQTEYTTLPLITLNAETVETLLLRTLGATTNEESRYALNAINWEFGKKVKATATNGHYLVHAQHKAEAISLTLLIPKKTCQEVLALSRISDVLSIECDDLTKPSLVKFQSDNHEITSRLMNGQFPNYELVIPKEKDLKKVEVPLDLLRPAVKRCLLMADERTHCIALDMADNTLTLNSASSDVGASSESIAIQLPHDPVKISLNGSYFTEALSTMESETLNLQFKDGNTQFLMREEVKLENDTTVSFWQIIMPMRA